MAPLEPDLPGSIAPLKPDLPWAKGPLKPAVLPGAMGPLKAAVPGAMGPLKPAVPGAMGPLKPAVPGPLARERKNDFSDDPTLPRVLGMYSVLKAIALIHVTLFIHYIPVISMGICSILLTLLMYLTEALYFQSATLNFYIVFPCVLNGITMIGLMIVPKKYLNAPTVAEDENAELLRQATAFKKRKQQPKKFS